MKLREILKIVFMVVTMHISVVQAMNYKVGLAAGYTDGSGIMFNGTISHLARHFPFQIRLGIGYTNIENPGKALDARRIFINNATNGTPQKYGHVWDFRMDLFYPVHWLKLPSAYFYAGPRYASFMGNFNFINGNEEFEVMSHHWGLGVGLNNSFHVSKRLELVVDSGVDYFFPGTLHGHDTSYTPDNENVNPREDYKYGDADAAINQPKFGLRFLMGLNYFFR